jgi:hypothetical protein
MPQYRPTDGYGRFDPSGPLSRAGITAICAFQPAGTDVDRHCGSRLWTSQFVGKHPFAPYGRKHFALEFSIGTATL